MVDLVICFYKIGERKREIIQLKQASKQMFLNRVDKPKKPSFDCRFEPVVWQALFYDECENAIRGSNLDGSYSH